jgi:hypothetical protein
MAAPSVKTATMAQTEVTRFLEDAVFSAQVRGQLAAVQDAQGFVQAANVLGYHFSKQQFVDGVKLLGADRYKRSQTGVWPWLRSLPNPFAEYLTSRAKGSGLGQSNRTDLWDSLTWRP